MNAAGGLRALLEGIVDYAGLFPPAKLGMAPAVAEYAGHRADDEAWMLSRFICPIARLEEFETASAEATGAGRGPWPMSVLGRGGADRAGFLAALDEEMEILSAFHARRGERAEAEVLEVRIPGAEGDPEEWALDLLREAGEHLARPGVPLEQIFLELPIARDDDPALPGLMRGLRRYARQDPPAAVGAKIRTGGVETAAFPSPARVAHFVLSAHEAGIPFKATAGLHHPVRHHAAEVGTRMHGFLNLFTGAALVDAGRADRATLQRILEDEDPAAFRFDNHGLAWRGLRCDLEEITRARHRFALGYGSCSFREPVEDLEALRLL